MALTGWNADAAFVRSSASRLGSRTNVASSPFASHPPVSTLFFFSFVYKTCIRQSHSSLILIFVLYDVVIAVVDAVFSWRFAISSSYYPRGTPGPLGVSETQDFQRILIRHILVDLIFRLSTPHLGKKSLAVLIRKIQDPGDHHVRGEVSSTHSKDAARCRG